MSTARFRPSPPPPRPSAAVEGPEPTPGAETCRFCDPDEPCRFHRPKDKSEEPVIPLPQRTPFREFELAGLPSGVGSGFHVTKPLRPRRRLPEWVANDKMMDRVLRSHPQAHMRFARWKRIVYLYFRLNIPAREIAEELDMTTKAVERVIAQLRRRAARGLKLTRPESEQVGVYKPV